MSYCTKCGQYGQADGGIGCVCGACRCRGGDDPKRFCAFCRPCGVCGRSIVMHVAALACGDTEAARNARLDAFSKRMGWKKEGGNG